MKPTRFWVEFDYPRSPSEGIVLDGDPGPSRCGVTAWGRDDALDLLNRYFNQEWHIPLPAIRRLVEDVDISSLPMEVQGNMTPPVWRGIWFPSSGLT